MQKQEKNSQREGKRRCNQRTHKNHQGKNVVEFIDFGSKKEAIDLIELSSRFYKRANKSPRG